jgi:hypothetical protein
MLRVIFRHKMAAENEEFGYPTMKNFLMYVSFILRPQKEAGDLCPPNIHDKKY